MDFPILFIFIYFFKSQLLLLMRISSKLTKQHLYWYMITGECVSDPLFTYCDTILIIIIFISVLLM